MSLQSLNIDKYGLDEIDNKILLTIIDKFRGGPVGVSTIATAIGEDSGTVEEVYEPFLIMEGFIKRTPRGRVATQLAYDHLGRNAYQDNPLQPGIIRLKETPLQTFTTNNAMEFFFLIVPTSADICKLFSPNSKPIHALLAS